MSYNRSKRMDPFRAILPTLTALMVLLNALLCMCGPASAAATGTEPAAVASQPSCHGQTAPADGEQGRDDDSHNHGTGCDCHSSAVATDAKPVQLSAGHSGLPSGALLALLPFWQGLSLEGVLPRLRGDYSLTLAFPAQQSSLLRLHCALIV